MKYEEKALKVVYEALCNTYDKKYADSCFAEIQAIKDERDYLKAKSEEQENKLVELNDILRSAVMKMEDK